ncbi:MAG: hypothetical protein ACJ76N_21370 [Thermoanaerobaculia bacterium]
MPDSLPDAGGWAPARLLPALAWANVALHGAGLAAAWLWMRPGSVVSPLGDRIAFLAGRPLGWSLGWGVWMLCTLLLVGYIATLRRLVPDCSLAAQLALIFTAAGMAVDLLADAVQIQVLPLAARSGQPLFLAFERLALTGGATVANGLYTLGVLLMILALRSQIGKSARAAGAATVAAGALMALSGLLPSPELLAASTGPTIGFYSLWTLLVARDLKSP